MNIASNATMPTKCSTIYLNDSADELVKKNLALGRMIPRLDPGKLVLDAIKASLRVDNDNVFETCIVLLEKLIYTNYKTTPELGEEAFRVGIEWIAKVKANPKNLSRVLCCLLFLAAYGVGNVATHEVLLTLLESFLSYDKAPKMFRLLGLKKRVPDVVRSLKKEEYLAMFRFICEFHLFKLCPGKQPQNLLREFLDSSEKAAQGSREKIRADAVMAFECIREAKIENVFPGKILKRLIAVKDDVSTEPVYYKSNGKGQSTRNAIIIPYEDNSGDKRQRLTKPFTPFKNSTVSRLGDVSVPSVATNTNFLFGSMKADTLRELLPLNESELSNAIKSTADPAKLVVDTSMSLSPLTNPNGRHEFKLLITPTNFSLLLSQLKILQPQISQQLKGDAEQLAIYWKDKISKNKPNDELEIVCFLQFLGIFGIVSEFKANDLLALLDNPNWQTISPDLVQFLKLDDAIPSFIENLIMSGHRMKAIDYIYSFGLGERYNVSNIIKDFLRITKESSEKSFNVAKNDESLLVAAIDKQIKSLRVAIRCVSSHKLESEFPLENLKEEIKLLHKRRGNITEGSPEPYLTVKLEEASDGVEIGSLTSNTPLEPSSSSVGDERRGEKRSFAEHSSVYYPDQYGTLNFRYNFMPTGGAQLYQFYPCYRNHY